jgi:hypothetical protein
MGITGVGAGFLGSQTAAAVWIAFNRGRARLVARRLGEMASGRGQPLR